MMQFTRLPDWPERLAAFVESRMLQPFSWGDNTCCHFSADWVFRMTESDPLQGLRGSWSTRTEAAKVLRALGGLQAAVTAALGEPVAPAFARRGDLMLVKTESADQLGRALLTVSLGAQCAAPTRAGLRTLPAAAVAVMAWRVG